MALEALREKQNAKLFSTLNSKTTLYSLLTTLYFYLSRSTTYSHKASIASRYSDSSHTESADIARCK